MTNRLYRSSREKMIGGVCGGLADYFAVDVTLVRLIALITLFMEGAGALLYIAALFIIPSDQQEGAMAYGGQGDHVQDILDEVVQNVRDTAKGFGVNGDEEHRQRGRTAGLILIVLGAFFLLHQWFPTWFSLSKMWPLVLIILGAALIWKKP